MPVSFQRQFSFSSGLITPRVLGNSNIQKYQNALADSQNLICGIYGYITARTGFKYIAQANSNSVKSYLYPFTSAEDSYVLEFTNVKLRFFKDGGQVLDGGGVDPYYITTPYATADCDKLIMAQSFDVQYITSDNNYKIQKLTRISDNSWTIADTTLVDGPYLDENTTSTTITPSATTGTITLTASASIFASTDVGRLVRFKSGPDNTDARLYATPGAAQVYFDVSFFPISSDTVEVLRYETTGTTTTLTYNSGVLGANDFKISGNQVLIYAALSAGQKLLVQRKNTCSGVWGYCTITAYSSGTSVTATVNNTLSGTNASTYWRLGAFSATTGYPKVCCFHSQRLWFANTDTQPDGIWASRIESFEDFSPDNDTHKEQIDSDTAFSAVISDIIAIKWMKPTSTLLLGGHGIKAINKNNPEITAATLSVTPEEATNSSDVEPVVTANEVIFVNKQRKVARSISYTFQSQAFSTQDLNQLADQIFEVSQCQKIVYQPSPVSLLWGITDANELVSCTYSKENGIVAWNKHTVGGTSSEVESICTIPYDGASQLWAVVKRTINGGTKRYIELMAEPFYLDDQEDAAFSDSYLVYDGASVTTITGLSHLEGQSVVIQSNGGIQAPKTVASGTIYLDAATTHAVIGLGYDMYGETVPLDQGKPNGVAIGSLSRISEVILDLYETMGIQVGYNSEDLQEVNLRDSGVVGGSIYPLFTGQKRQLVSSNSQVNYKIYFENPYPLPFTLRNITYVVSVS